MRWWWFSERSSPFIRRPTLRLGCGVGLGLSLGLIDLMVGFDWMCEVFGPAGQLVVYVDWMCLLQSDRVTDTAA